MSYRNKTYVIFDGDHDIYAYGFMRGWKSLDHLEFDFHDAHDLGVQLTDRASEETVKRCLRQRFSSAKQAIVLIGPNTRNLYRFVRWEIEVALDLSLPIIAVNLNQRSGYDANLCPPILRNVCAIHVPFKMKAIKLAMNNFPAQHAQQARLIKGPIQYSAEQYRNVGIPIDQRGYAQ
ncbi:MAG TPA: TIR domain-containing protein [Bryobacteraceae bacterium]|nr:TIR domain-containing protein [Bryobacteraceae bacterium]